MAQSILIVDDDKNATELLSQQLKNRGYEVEVVGDGYTGLEKAKKQKPDLMILDVMLPKMDGYNVCRLLKFDHDYKNIPIIMFTSLSGEEKKKISQEVGADAYVSKPYVLEELLTTVSDILNRKKK
ncbi:response regulator transcription factor [Candidatus Margulisiibacteriota bacterium]